MQELRTELDKLLQRCITSPGSLGSPHDSSLLNAIIDLVTTEEQRDQPNHVFTVSRHEPDRTLLRLKHPTRLR